MKGYVRMTTQCLLSLLAACFAPTNGCTNFIITKGASLEGRSAFAYTADAGMVFGEIVLLPAADHAPGTMRKIWRLDDGKYLGEIPEVAHTYHVVANMNEHQLAIGETTFTGRPELKNPDDIVTMDYWNLIYITLQRARTAREAISTMNQLVTDYGWGSTGESFTIQDPEETWHMEMIGKGQEKGAVWVARRIPDGYIGAHSNQARITTFDHHEDLYSTDLISWARRAGYYPNEAPDEAFDFSAMANPISFHGCRYGETRVWDYFRRSVSGFAEEHLEYVKGLNLSRRMPLWVKPERSISLNDTLWYMRSHFEGTFFDMTKGVGAGPYGAAVRARPTSWSVGGKDYVNERPVATQQTGWHFIAVSRPELPAALGGVTWFGVDDTAFAAHIPVWSHSFAVPAGWTRRPVAGLDAAHTSINAHYLQGRPGTVDAFVFSLDSAFWVHNLVANLVYARWDASIEVQAKIAILEASMVTQAAALETEAAALCAAGREEAAIGMLTNFSVRSGQGLIATWSELWKALFVRYRDGMVTTYNPAKQNGDLAWVNAAEVGYPVSWYARMASKHLEAPAGATPTARAVAANLSQADCSRTVCPLAEEKALFAVLEEVQKVGESSLTLSVFALLVAMGMSTALGALAGALAMRVAQTSASEATQPLANSLVPHSEQHRYISF